MVPSPIKVALSPQAADSTRLRLELDKLTANSQINLTHEADCAEIVHLVPPGQCPRFPDRTIVIGCDRSEDNYRQAITAGVAALIAPGISAGRLFAVIAAVDNGLAVVPVELAAGIAGRIEAPPDTPPLTPDQSRLLLLITRGLTVTEISTDIGYSERHTRRRLQQLWATLGATNRTSGIIRATRYGLLE